jgi:alpha-galactosidase
MAKWGIDMVKADYCHKPGNESGQALYTQFSQALNATGRPILFSMCQWGNDNVVEWGGAISQMYRIQMDHIPFWSWPPKAAGVGYGQGTKEIINFMADLHPSKYNKPHAWMDPDFLESLFLTFLGKYGLDHTNSRTEFTFWCLWSSPLLLATDPDLSDEKRSIIMNQEMVDIDQDDSPAGERIRNDNSTTGAQVWMRTMSNKDVVVVLYNSGDNSDVKVTATWAELGLSPDVKMNVRSLWDKAELGTLSGQIEATLKAHDVAVLRLRLP